MTLGRAPVQEDLLKGTAAFCADRVGEGSIYALLHRECHRLFADEMFADLFTDVGRRSIPPRIVAVVMVLQRLEGLSDREAVERFCFDARWKYAAGGLDFDYPGFVHTVLVDMRARLHRSERPKRIFETVLEVAKKAGLVGRRRVLDSTPLYDAVATMDTVTLIRSAIRRLLEVFDDALRAEIRDALRRDDDYEKAGKPTCDWDDAASREALVDALATDAMAALLVLDGRPLDAAQTEAARLVATVVGQDLEEGDDGVFRIARRVAKDRVISTVDPDARHGHKTAARGFDGYKGHLAVDPDSELITSTAVTSGNTGDAAAAAELLSECLPKDASEQVQGEPTGDKQATTRGEQDAPTPSPHVPGEAEQRTQTETRSSTDTESTDTESTDTETLRVYGDAAYGAGALLAMLTIAGVAAMIKVQRPVAPGGRFPKDRFAIDLDARTVTCPSGATVALRPLNDGGGQARFGQACAECPLRAMCTSSPSGRVVNVSAHEAELQKAREAQADPAWGEDYRGTRPKVERKIAHLMRRKHGGRRARVRGRPKVDNDFSLLAAAVNLGRLAVLGVRSAGAGWVAASA